MKIEEKQGGLTFVGAGRDVDASQESAAKRRPAHGRPASSVAVGLRVSTGARRNGSTGAAGEPHTPPDIHCRPAELRFAMFLKRARSSVNWRAARDSNRAASQ